MPPSKRAKLARRRVSTSAPRAGLGVCVSVRRARRLLERGADLREAKTHLPYIVRCACGRRGAEGVHEETQDIVSRCVRRRARRRTHPSGTRGWMQGGLWGPEGGVRHRRAWEPARLRDRLPSEQRAERPRPMHPGLPGHVPDGQGQVQCGAPEMRRAVQTAGGLPVDRLSGILRAEPRQLRARRGRHRQGLLPGVPQRPGPRGMHERLRLARSGREDRLSGGVHRVHRGLRRLDDHDGARATDHDQHHALGA